MVLNLHLPLSITDEQEDLEEIRERARIDALPEQFQHFVAEHHWQMLQATPSYVECQAQAFALEMQL